MHSSLHICRSSLRILQRCLLISTKQCPARFQRITARFLAYDPRKAQVEKPDSREPLNHGHEDRVTNEAQKHEDQDSTGQQSGATVPQLTNRQKLQQFFKEYGTVGFLVHTSLSLTSLGIFYCLVSSGLDVPLLLSKVGVSGGNLGTVASGASTFVIAYACHKIFMPVRIFLTLSLTPVLVRKLRSIGLLKPPAPKV